MLDFNHVRQLLKDMQEPVVTLYLHVDAGLRANQAEPPAWQIYMKNALSDIVTQAADSEQTRLQNIKTRIETYLSGYTPSGKTLIFFIGEKTQHIHELPIALENNFAYGEPFVVPLLWAIDEHQRYLIVLADQEQARFLTAYLGRATTDEEMSIDFDAYDFGQKRYVNNNRGGRVEGTSPGQSDSQDRFEDMLSAHLKRFYKDVAEQTREFVEKMGVSRVILGGNEKSAHAIRDLLHDKVKNRVITIQSIPIDAAEHQVVQRIEESALQYERNQEMALVEDVIGLAKSGRRGVLGVDKVQRAFEMQQIELLILPYPITDEQLAADLTLQALNSGTRIELVHGEPAMKLRDEGGLAARLYYTVGEAQES